MRCGCFLQMKCVKFILLFLNDINVARKFLFLLRCFLTKENIIVFIRSTNVFLKNPLLIRL